ncbi:ATP-binding protein [Streptomyces spiramenti]|uniref:ATP-binding protein n=1 Tax=Streptomyces spiramenti TaxID=2720606 RepID=A0ABX1AMR7_9ACTN|nr:ATP-binding protein [Streptomyces spiramenti]NJP65913.1 ATP-binding protein [Streptomyces spiramenti]
MPETPGETGRRDAGGQPVSACAAYEGSEELGEARSLAERFLEAVRTTGGVDVGADARMLLPLVVSELVTNVRRHAPGPHMLELELVAGCARVSVWDTDPALPVIREKDPRRVGGHGLEIVTAVCTGFEMHRELVGKRLTAVLPLHDATV